MAAGCGGGTATGADGQLIAEATACSGRRVFAGGTATSDAMRGASKACLKDVRADLDQCAIGDGCRFTAIQLLVGHRDRERRAGVRDCGYAAGKLIVACNLDTRRCLSGSAIELLSSRPIVPPFESNARANVCGGATASTDTTLRVRPVIVGLVSHAAGLRLVLSGQARSDGRGRIVAPHRMPAFRRQQLKVGIGTECLFKRLPTRRRGTR